MNIFITNSDPAEAVKDLDDKRLVKMVLETAQLLSNACHHYLGEGPYKKTHWNHPCSKILREDYLTLNWVCWYFWHIYREYIHRFNKTHKCAQYLDIFTEAETKAYDLYVEEHGGEPNHSFPIFPNCTNYKDYIDVFDAYRRHLIDKWTAQEKPPKWTNRNPPIWAGIDRYCEWKAASNV